MTKALVEKFVIADAAALSGLTATMLDYLCREKILVPSYPGRRGRGCARHYSFGDVVILRALARLLKSGVSVQRLKKALHAIRKYHKDILRNSLPAPYLVTDGSRIFLREREALLDLDGSEQMSFLFVLELNQVRDEVIRAYAAAGG
jgi:DNA-binding transcriptional MerR regulator